jgi:outer membrane protein
MKKNMTILAITLVGGLLTCQSVLAADSKTSLGLGAGLAPDYEGSDDYTFVPMIYGRYSYGDGAYVQLQGTELKWNFLNDKVEFGPLLQYRMSRNDVESNRVEKMDKVDSAIAAGAFLTGRVDNFSATVKFATDVSDDDTGYTVTLGGDYQAKVSEKLKMTFGLSTTYASDDYMETYFQIDNGNRGNTTLKNYKSNDGEWKDVGVHLVANYSFNSNWSVVGNLGYKHLLGDAKDSPIVDDAGSESQMFLGATAVYTF